MDKKLSVILNYQLEQHTPIIHFQYYETGAVLRGSEVKPKLDKFLVKKYKQDKQNNGKSMPKEYFIGDTEALNYKMSFIVKKEPEKIIEQDKRNTNMPMYFGNMGEKSLEKKGVLYNNADLEMRIVCFNKKLREYIDQYVEEFFATTNFGTRQSKGYGSFTLANTRANQILGLLNKGKYPYFYTTTKKDHLNMAAAVYAVMKGGINFSFRDSKYVNGKEIPPYIKGYIQRPFWDDIGEECIRSDKAFMKSKVLLGKKREKEDKKDFSDNANYKYVRGLFGIAESVEFKDHIRTGVVKIEGKEKIIENGKEKPVIQRFKSPVTIKIVDDYIFFIFNDSYKNILGKEFEFFVDEKAKDRQSIAIPDQFDMNQFMDGFIDYFHSYRERFMSIGAPYKNAQCLKLVRGGKKHA